MLYSLQGREVNFVLGFLGGFGVVIACNLVLLLFFLYLRNRVIGSFS